MIIKEYSCEKCLHESVCCYKIEMQQYFDKLRKEVNDNNFNYIPSYYQTSPLPSVAYCAIKCNFFTKQGSK